MLIPVYFLEYTPLLFWAEGYICTEFQVSAMKGCFFRIGQSLIRFAERNVVFLYPNRSVSVPFSKRKIFLLLI